jgi:hypothetical protein
VDMAVDDIMPPTIEWVAYADVPIPAGRVCPISCYPPHLTTAALTPVPFHIFSSVAVDTLCPSLLTAYVVECFPGW